MGCRGSDLLGKSSGSPATHVHQMCGQRDMPTCPRYVPPTAKTRPTPASTLLVSRAKSRPRAGAAQPAAATLGVHAASSDQLRATSTDEHGHDPQHLTTTSAPQGSLFHDSGQVQLATGHSSQAPGTSLTLVASSALVIPLQSTVRHMFHHRQALHCIPASTGVVSRAKSRPKASAAQPAAATLGCPCCFI